MNVHGVRGALQAHTKNIHEALHEAAPFAAIARGSISFGGYAALLQFLHAYHSAMADLCAAGAAALEAPQLAAAHAARIGALEKDIVEMGGAVSRETAIAPQGPGFSIGCLYTVQGSTLGGKVIHRQLDALLPDDKGRGFFKGGAEDGHLWQEFCARLETRDDVEDIAAGAAFAFEQFRLRLENCAVC